MKNEMINDIIKLENLPPENVLFLHWYITVNSYNISPIIRNESKKLSKIFFSNFPKRIPLIDGFLNKPLYVNKLKCNDSGKNFINVLPKDIKESILGTKLYSKVSKLKRSFLYRMRTRKHTLLIRSKAIYIDIEQKDNIVTDELRTILDEAFCIYIALKMKNIKDDIFPSLHYNSLQLEEYLYEINVGMDEEEDIYSHLYLKHILSEYYIKE